MIDHDSIFAQSIRSASLNHRIIEQGRLRKEMTNDIKADKQEMIGYDADFWEHMNVIEKDPKNSRVGDLADALSNICKWVCREEKIQIAFRVIVNGPATILFVGGRKYVAKCHDEAFDIKKGILVCVAKHLGVTHSRIKAILKRRGLANSQDAELCLLWDIADREGFDEEVIDQMVKSAEVHVKVQDKDAN